MGSILFDNRIALHAGAFGIFLVILLLCERFLARRPFQYPKFRRDAVNLSLAFLNNLILHASFPLLALGAGVLAVEKGWGFFQVWDGPFWLEVLLGILALDLIIYAQHVAFHHIPVLWRLHRVHHADVELDVTTGIRFHPLEIMMSMGIKIGAVLALGAPPLTVFLFELILLLSSMFNHANLNLPLSLDRLLRLVMITPDMHRVHHSVHVDETNSNFGFNFPWWDRLFKTYTAQPKDGHLKMTLGINLFRSPKWTALHRLLMEPFVGGDEGRHPGPFS